MLRVRANLLVVLIAFMYGGTEFAFAQDQGDDEGIVFEEDDVNEPTPEPEPEIEMFDEDGQPIEDDPAGGGGAEPDLEADLAQIGAGGDEGDAAMLGGENRVSWQDIVVVVRKPFLKVRRVEAMPLFGITMNDNIVQHVQGGAQVNYYLTDVLAVGLEAAAYVKNLREPFDQVAFQARRLPAVNQYNYSASLNFSYVPIYGKFAVLDQYLLHWESFFTAGVGVLQSEVIPRNPALQSFDNLLITPNVGVSMRFFLTKFLTVTIGVRDYIFIDKFEAAGRMEVSADDARDAASSSLINHVMFQAGISIWIPMGFEYTTFR